MARRAVRLDSIELALSAVLVALVAYQIGLWRGVEATRPAWEHPDDRAALETLQARFGPDHHSGHAEEWIIRDFFQDRRGGVFVDVGASDWRDGSNTYILERQLEWTGLAVDAAPGHAEGWRQNRRAMFFEAIVDEVDGEKRTLHFLPEQPGMSSLFLDHTRLFAGTPQVVHGTTVTLDTLLVKAGIDRIDLLSMDIELAEPAALRGFSIERYRPELVCIEAMPPVRQFILDYFASAGYVLVGKYHRADPWNMYFMPFKTGRNTGNPSSAPH